MFDRVLQTLLTVGLGICAIYSLVEAWIPPSVEIAQLKNKSKITKYFVALQFAVSVSWMLIGDAITRKSKTSQGNIINLIQWGTNMYNSNFGEILLKNGEIWLNSSSQKIPGMMSYSYRTVV